MSKKVSLQNKNSESFGCKMQMPNIDKDTLEAALASLKKAEEMISYAIQLCDAVHKEKIRPDDFEKRLVVPEPHSENQFYVDREWAKDPAGFKGASNDAQVCIVSYMIILCKESYPAVLWIAEGKESMQPGLYAAQIILKLIRDAMAHILTGPQGFAAPYWKITSSKYRKKFSIEEIGVALDATSLHGKQFKFSDIGGLANLLKILDYLAQDIQVRLSMYQGKTKQIYRRNLA